MSSFLLPGRAVAACFMLTSALALTSSISTPAQGKDLGAYGKLTGDVRVRYENVDDESRPRNGIARTVRAHLGYQTPEWNNLYAFGEVETVRHLGPTSFDDGLNGKTEFGRISDPQMNGINQLFVHYKHSDMTSLRVGRQILIYDNQRFVATSKSRQNDPTHDAIFAKIGLLDNLTLAYAHSFSYLRYSGSRSTSGRYEGNLDLLNLHYDAPFDIGASAYSYWLDFDGVPAEESLSSKTHGLRLTWEPKGEGLHPLAALEYAMQSDYGNSPLSYSENYFLGEAGGRYNDYKIFASVETLGGNGSEAMQTPIGAAHNLTGYTDRFSTIPPDGLRDIRLNVIAPFSLPWEGQSVELIGQVHSFSSDDGDIYYGKEFGLQATYKPAKDHAFNVKYGAYYADEFSADTDKLLVSYEYKF